MSDEELRRVERALAAEPQSVDLRRRHARVLSRTGRDDDALAAVDLAWRLGAEDLREELGQRLDAKRVAVGPLTLCYVPAGPFVMGSDTHDDDASPPHLVELSAFYITALPLQWGSLHDWEHYPEYWRESRSAEYRARWDAATMRTDMYSRVGEVATFLTDSATPTGLVGSYQLVSEAQWERAFRAAYLCSDGVSPYGVSPDPDGHPEWTVDHYESTFYDRSPRQDPVATSAQKGDLRVVRGVSVAPVPQYAVFREAVREDGHFPVGNFLTRRWVPHDGGLAVRLVFVPDPE